MKMYNPPHPGEVLQELYLQPLGLTVTETADALGVSHQILSAIIEGCYSITPDIAMRLSKAFSTNPTVWLGMEQDYDLWQVKQRLDLSEVRVLRDSESEFMASF
ncbi:MAG TPA: addiction module antidote protein, HigA family [Cyanobacteria bacterium UBA11149]|nr:addiction module antidote protein, HigA family [Cyanobacteria bacterium UBA11367]HBE56881.1 addiction module antidote protein, HigA family [Cyanobacteria bacterium UBA11366]HBK63121.1 addiction module antidote protein, HigA family [Cyanobacteria bacterium UBA11166]HBR73813.1 addiction module antidote protein, HigA family [Cyanobacteria bacterium UBA11159]HBS67584.1 addiction module antidote protein, HigA family [Cyanobacteria bacterium UBA11153]HBW88725.1 addiction module antidote protein, 